MSPPRGRARTGGKPHGQIRQSQIVTTFGPGAMVDLPDHAVIIGGLESWTGWRDHPVHEERLAAKVKALLRLDSIEFYAPPPDPDDPAAPRTGITAWVFPEWFIAQYEVKDKETGRRSRPLVHRMDLEKRHYVFNRKRYKVVPVRFVQACTRGHVSDIDWRLFVHGPDDKCLRQPLWMDERGTSGDLTAITIRCECGKTRDLSVATRVKDAPLGYCKGERPWLGAHAREQCGGNGGHSQPSRLLVRSASNAYFAQTLSVISIPEGGTALRHAIDGVWNDFLQYCESATDVGRERRKQRVSAALESFSDADVWKEIERRKSGGTADTRGIREVELETLLSAQSEIGDDRPGGDFFARTVNIPAKDSLIANAIERVVKVHRLREVIAQVGFTRFDSAVSDVNGELALDVERAALAREMSWVPAVENRGEGIFLAVKRNAIEKWLSRATVKARGDQLMAGFKAWAKAHSASSAPFPGLPYVMLHSLSHLLITAVALECGYAASSIRERIYVASAGYGVLLYTASADAEGTLGGLVEAADRIAHYLRHALDLGRLCANDPVCAHHEPDNVEEERFLLGAACHGCLLLAESSCERRNDFLDRALVVTTVDDSNAAFFPDEA
jgi:MrfA Zn-binding domain